MIDHEPVAWTFTPVYVPAETVVCPLLLFCPCTPSCVGSVELLLTVNVLVAHPAHCHFSCEALGTLTVPRDVLPVPVKDWGEPLVTEPLETVVVVVVVRVTVCVDVE